MAEGFFVVHYRDVAADLVGYVVVFGLHSFLGRRGNLVDDYAGLVL